MAAFRFKLQAVLRQRQLAEDERRKAVAELERLRLDTEREIEFWQHQIRREREEMASILTGGGSPALMRVQAGAALRLRGRIAEASVRLAGVTAKLQQAREALRRTAADRKAIELLRDQRRQAWLQERNRREARELDEFAVMRAARDPEGA